MKKTLVSFLCMLAIAYIVFSFVLWQFNPAFWGLDARFLLLYLVFAALFMYIIANA